MVKETTAQSEHDYRRCPVQRRGQRPGSTSHPESHARRTRRVLGASGTLGWFPPEGIFLSCAQARMMLLSAEGAGWIAAVR